MATIVCRFAAVILSRNRLQFFFTHCSEEHEIHWNCAITLMFLTLELNKNSSWPRPCWVSLQRSPRPLIRGERTGLPITHLLDIFSVLNLMPRGHDPVREWLTEKVVTLSAVAVSIACVAKCMWQGCVVLCRCRQRRELQLLMVGIHSPTHAAFVSLISVLIAAWCRSAICRELAASATNSPPSKNQL